MKYRRSTPNERVWCTTQLAKFCFSHSIGRTHSWRFQFFVKYVVLALDQLVHLCPFPLYPALLPITSTSRTSRAKVIMCYTGVLLAVLFMLVLAHTSWSNVAGSKRKSNHSLLLPFLLTVLFVMLYTYSVKWWTIVQHSNSKGVS